MTITNQTRDLGNGQKAVLNLHNGDGVIDFYNDGKVAARVMVRSSVPTSISGTMAQDPNVDYSAAASNLLGDYLTQ